VLISQSAGGIILGHFITCFETHLLHSTYFTLVQWQHCFASLKMYVPYIIYLHRLLFQYFFKVNKTIFCVSTPCSLVEVWLNLSLWRWSRYIPPKLWWNFTRRQGIVNQMIILFIDTAMRTPNPRLCCRVLVRVCPNMSMNNDVSCASWKRK
jgi:hypothetical protein